ncbi:hypothetical protein EP7_004278 [Isosphaeraceae bacterium EP7]
MSSEGAAVPRRAPPHVVFEAEFTQSSPLTGERAMWAAVVRCALSEARRPLLGSEAKSVHNEPRREARKWFRKRSRDYIGGWGWIIDSVGISPHMVKRIEAAAKASTRRDGG